jgi:hypothetical protein
VDVTPGGIDLVVEEVVLHGFEWVDGEQVGRRLERELRRLIAHRGVPAALSRGGRDRPTLEGLSFQLGRDAGADALAGQVARALYGGLAR